MIPEKYWDKTEVEKEHWFKTVIWETIRGFNDPTLGSIKQYQKWEYDIKTFGVCGTCNSADHLYLRSMPSGAYKACLKCAITTGPMPTEEGTGKNRKKFAKLVDWKNLETDTEISEYGVKLNWIFNKLTGWHP